MSLPVLLFIPIYTNLIFSYTILEVHTMEKDYVHTGLANNIPVPNCFTGNNYSPLVGCQRTNFISATSHPYDPSSMQYQSCMLPINTIPSNEHNMDSKYKPIEGLQKPSSVSKVIDDHPYRPNFPRNYSGS